MQWWNWLRCYSGVSGRERINLLYHERIEPVEMKVVCLQRLLSLSKRFLTRSRTCCNQSDLVSTVFTCVLALKPLEAEMRPHRRERCNHEKILRLILKHGTEKGEVDNQLLCTIFLSILEWKSNPRRRSCCDKKLTTFPKGTQSLLFTVV